MAKRAKVEQPAGESAPRPAKRRPKKTVRLTCGECATRFQAAVEQGQTETHCLACNKPVEIPGRKKNSEEAENRKGPDVFAAMAEERYSGEAQRPPLPFLMGTFTFPWYPEALFRWLALSLGCAFVVVLYVAMHWCFSRGGWFARAGYAFGFPFGWISIWTFSYAASGGIVILTETAAGNDRITGWADPDWRDWMADLLSLMPSILTAVSLAFGIGKLVELLGGPFWTPAGIAFFFLLPICLLSTIDANSPFVPFSALVMKSLALRAWAWLRFYAASAVLAVFWPGSLILGYRSEPFYTAAITAPLMGIALLVYPRLLGRLGGEIADLQGE